MMNERARRRHKEPLIFLKVVLHSEGADTDSVGPEACTVFGIHFKGKKAKNFEYKIGYEIEYLSRTRKEITT
jgi:hypothetical protein